MRLHLPLACALAASLVGNAIAAPPAPPEGKSPAISKSGGPKGGPKGAARSGPGSKAMRRMEGMANRLNLTPEQRSKAKALQDQAMDQLRKLREAPGTRESKRPKAQAIVKATRDKIEALLTPAQKQKLAQMRASERISRQRGNGGMKNASGPKPPAKPGTPKTKGK